jgi:TolB-like protein/class 3 adenylate cyclase/tetratricopeptide (TPR) repeat protein
MAKPAGRLPSSSQASLRQRYRAKVVTVSVTGIVPDLAGKASGGRRLVAVVYADMVGYSRLISQDDAGTLRRLRTLRRALIDPAIREYGGKVVQTGGDSLLLMFDSIDGAVRCAIKVQQQVPVYDGDQPPDRRIRFRIGINTGDAIPHGSDLHGEGVNIAARLEAACPPGGICVSRVVRDQVHGHLDLPFEPIGSLTLKNIPQPVEAYVVRLDRTGSGTRHRARAALFATLAALLLVTAGGAGWWFYHSAGTNPLATQPMPNSVPVTTQAQKFTPPDIGLSNAPRLSLVVLPLNNLGGEGVNDDLADGITDDLTTALARWPDLLVIARNSAFTYKGKPVDIKRVGEELGVRYVVEGSVRSVGGKLPVNVQLVSTESGSHLWADHFDVERDGAGYGVDDIVRQIGIALGIQLYDIEATRGMRERPTNPQVADILLQARSLYYRPVNPELQSRIVALSERAVELDPTSAASLAGLAEALLDSIFQNEDPAAPSKIRRAEELLSKAEQLRPDSGKVLWIRVYLLGAQRRCPEVIPAAQRAIELMPDCSGCRFRLAICLISTGRAADAVPALEQAIRVNPRNPQNFNRYDLMGYALICLERYDEAVTWLQRSLVANPNQAANRRANTHAAIAAAHALAGRTKEAHASAAEASRLWPMITVRLFFQFTGANSTNPVLVAQISRMRDGLRQAGMRDHADENADSGVPPDGILHVDYNAYTPTTVPGAQTIRTPDLEVLIEQRKPLVLDASPPWGMSISGAVGLWGGGVGGSVSDEYHDRLKTKMQQLTKGDLNTPVVTMGWNAERYQGRNLALRLVALGYTNVYWYRGGREAWEVAGLPETEVDVQDW